MARRRNPIDRAFVGRLRPGLKPCFVDSWLWRTPRIFEVRPVEFPTCHDFKPGLCDFGALLPAEETSNGA